MVCAGVEHDSILSAALFDDDYCYSGRFVLNFTDAGDIDARELKAGYEAWTELVKADCADDFYFYV